MVQRTSRSVRQEKMSLKRNPGLWTETSVATSVRESKGGHGGIFGHAQARLFLASSETINNVNTCR